jgi:hypothetical protein
MKTEQEKQDAIKEVTHDIATLLYLTMLEIEAPNFINSSGIFDADSESYKISISFQKIDK